MIRKTYTLKPKPSFGNPLTRSKLDPALSSYTPETASIETNVSAGEAQKLVAQTGKNLVFEPISESSQKDQEGCSGVQAAPKEPRFVKTRSYQALKKGVGAKLEPLKDSSKTGLNQEKKRLELGSGSDKLVTEKSKPSRRALRRGKGRFGGYPDQNQNLRKRTPCAYLADRAELDRQNEAQKVEKRAKFSRDGAISANFDVYKAKIYAMLNKKIEEQRTGVRVNFSKQEAAKLKRKVDRKFFTIGNEKHEKIGFLKKFDFLSILGVGASSEVHLIVNEENRGQKFAFKFYKNQSGWPSALQEGQILKQIDHENVIKCIRLYKSPRNSKSHLVLEYANGINLSHFIFRNSRSCLSEFTTQRIAIQILRALRYLHSRGFSHRDLKPDNIIITNELKVKIIDFAFAIKQKFKRQTQKANCGTPNYMAPEIICKKDSWPQPADVWAFAVILVRMRTGKLLYEGKNMSELKRRISKEDLRDNPVWNEIGDERMKSCLALMLKKDPDQRPSAKELLEMPYFKQIK